MTKCGQCGFENDPTRIFCQNCGSRLENAASAAAPDRGKLFIPQGQQAPAAVRKPIKPVSVGSAAKRKGGPRLGWLISSLIMGATLAAVVQMVRPPDSVPPPVTGNDKQAADVYSAITAASDNPYPRTLGLAMPQINNYLAARILPPAASEGGGIQARFSRAFVELADGTYKVTMQQDIAGWPVYISIVQRPSATAAGLTTEDIAGNIGRLPIHPKLLPLLEKLVDPVFSSLTDVTGQFKTATSITVQPSLVLFAWPGTAKHP